MGSIRRVIAGALSLSIALGAGIYVFGWFFLHWPGLVAYLTGSNGFLAGFADMALFIFVGIPLYAGIGMFLARAIEGK